MRLFTLACLAGVLRLRDLLPLGGQPRIEVRVAAGYFVANTSRVLVPVPLLRATETPPPPRSLTMPRATRVLAATARTVCGKFVQRAGYLNANSLPR